MLIHFLEPYPNPTIAITCLTIILTTPSPCLGLALHFLPLQTRNNAKVATCVLLRIEVLHVCLLHATISGQLTCSELYQPNLIPNLPISTYVASACHYSSVCIFFSK